MAHLCHAFVEYADYDSTARVNECELNVTESTRERERERERECKQHKESIEFTSVTSLDASHRRSIRLGEAGRSNTEHVNIASGPSSM